MNNKFNWGSSNLINRMPLIDTGYEKNFAGSIIGCYGVNRAISLSQNKGSIIASDHKITDPFGLIRSNDSWFEKHTICFMDPFGGCIDDIINISPYGQPTIAVTDANLYLPEIALSLQKGILSSDGHVLKSNGSINVKKISIQPVWYLPWIEEKMGIQKEAFRKALCYSLGYDIGELEKDILVPPLHANTVYIISKNMEFKNISLRIHDECNSSDVFGSDMCSCRPYLLQAIETCIKSAQNGNTGIIVYMRNEGRGIGEVNKYLVYNRRKYFYDNQPEHYYLSAEEVSGENDLRVQLIPAEIIKWLGISEIENFISMSPTKYNALLNSGIKIKNRITINGEYLTEASKIEIKAKINHGYFAS